MKRRLFWVIAAIMIMALAACSAPVAQEESSPSSDKTQAPEVVTFADPVLEAKVRAAMGIPEGDITKSEAEAVAEMYFGIEWQTDVSEEAQIADLGGLEYFKNLKSLNLSSNAVTDISLLTGLTKLISLSLSGNPVADISPLSGMTNLEKLSLSGCAAEDYSSLGSLHNLKVLLLDNSTINDISALSGLTELTYLSLKDTQVSDVSPLAGLNGLTQLYLAECPVDDYSPLANIYANLEEKDFSVPFSLEELGFTRSSNNVLASYSAEGLIVTVNHSEWGIPEMDLEANTIRLSSNMDDGYKLTVGYDPGNQNYVFNISQNGEGLTDYVYITLEDNLMFGGDREVVENAIRTMLGDMDSDDILLAPIPFFNDTIRETFGMTVGALFALPFGPPTLLNLGFMADQENLCYRYEQHDPRYYSIEVNNPEWGNWDEGGDVRFFTPLSDEYRIVIYYYIDEKKFSVGADDNDGGGASYEYFVETDEYSDIWCSDNTLTVGQYFKNAYNDPEIEDVYLYPMELMEQYISDTFGMTIEELYTLPVGT